LLLMTTCMIPPAWAKVLKKWSMKRKKLRCLFLSLCTADVQLDIKDPQGRALKTLQESFKAYVAPRKMDDNKKYYAGEIHGLQDATKGTVFMEFPPVLHVHLKRSEYNFQKDKQVKVWDVTSITRECFRTNSGIRTINMTLRSTIN
jgi:hypothetical protein